MCWTIGEQGSTPAAVRTDLLQRRKRRPHCRRRYGAFYPGNTFVRVVRAVVPCWHHRRSMGRKFANSRGLRPPARGDGAERRYRHRAPLVWAKPAHRDNVSQGHVGGFGARTTPMVSGGTVGDLNRSRSGWPRLRVRLSIDGRVSVRRSRAPAYRFTCRFWLVGS